MSRVTRSRPPNRRIHERENDEAAVGTQYMLVAMAIAEALGLVYLTLNA